jgi:hypothetical protein
MQYGFKIPESQVRSYLIIRLRISHVRYSKDQLQRVDFPGGEFVGKAFLGPAPSPRSLNYLNYVREPGVTCMISDFKKRATRVPRSKRK